MMVRGKVKHYIKIKVRFLVYHHNILLIQTIARDLLWPRGPTDTASDFESEDCGFESHRGQNFSFSRVDNMII